MKLFTSRAYRFALVVSFVFLYLCCSVSSVLAEGEVWGWGQNRHGQTGASGTLDILTPVKSNAFEDFVYICGGINHSVAIRSDGTVWAWGYNRYGQLGDGTFDEACSFDCPPHSYPVRVYGLSDVVQVSAGTHTVALKSDGTVWTWGYNGFGQLGIGTNDKDPHPTPVQVPNLTDVVAIDAGWDHTLALKSDGSVWAWGYNEYGQLGNGNATDTYYPVRVSGLSDVAAIDANYVHSAALKSDGSVWTWGCNWAGMLGHGQSDFDPHPFPSPASGLSNVVQVSTGFYNTVALKSDGTVWICGENYYGELGNGTTDWDQHPIAAPVPGLSDVIAVCAGDLFTVAVKSDGIAWAWGRNICGQLGNGTKIDNPTPGQVVGLSGITDVSSCGWFMLALKSLPDIYSHITSPADGEVLGGSALYITGEAAATQGVASVEVSTDGGFTWNTATDASSGDEEPWARWSYRWKPLGEGDYNLICRATDITSKEEIPGPGITVTIDTSGPTTEITSPEEGGGPVYRDYNYLIEGTAEDAAGGSGIDYVQISTDNGTTWSDALDTSRDGSWSTWEFEECCPIFYGDPNNRYITIKCQARDKAGNFGPVQAIKVQLSIYITDINLEYKGSALNPNSFFLEGISLPITFNAVVDWNGQTFNWVEFITSGKFREKDDTSGGDTFSKTIDVGLIDNFSEGGWLKAYAQSGEGTQSEPKFSGMHIMSNPFVWGAFSNVNLENSLNGNSIINYNFVDISLGPAKLVNAGADVGKIPDDFPYFGGKAFKFTSYVGLDATINSNGESKIMLSRDIKHDNKLNVKTMGRQIDVNLFGYVGGNYNTDTLSWNLLGSYGAGFEATFKRTRYWLVYGVPIYAQGTAHLIGDANFKLKWDNGINIQDGNALADLFLKGAFGVGICDALSVEGWIGVGGRLKVHLPDITEIKQCSLYSRGGFTVTYLIAQSEFVPLDYYWDFFQGSSQPNSMMLTKRTLLSPAKKLIPRDYIDIPISGEFHPRPMMMPITAHLSAQLGAPGIAAEGLIQSDVFPYSNPDVSSVGTNILHAVWVQDNINRFSVNRTEAAFSAFDGANWSPAAAIDDDGTADYAPRILSFSDGTAIAAWEDCDHVLADLPADPTPAEVQAAEDEMTAGLDISASVYDGSSWSAPDAITSNGYLDLPPMLAGPSYSNAMLVWLTNASNDMFGSSTAPSQVMSAVWDGTSWSAPAAGPQIEFPVFKTDFAYNGANGLLVMSVDTDDDISTIEDRELFTASYDDTTGWGSVVQLTDDSGAVYVVTGPDLNEYRCIKDHNSSNPATEPGAGKDYDMYWEKTSTSSGAPVWVSGTDYTDFKGLIDANPKVEFDGTGRSVITWLDGNDIASITGLDMGTRVVVTTPEFSSGAADFDIASSPNGRIAVIWPGASTDEASQGTDLFAAFYDPVGQIWGEHKQVSFDEDSERFISAAFFSDDVLAAVYDKARFGETIETVTFYDADNQPYQEDIHIPVNEGTDLYYMTYTTGNDLAMQGESMTVNPPNTLGNCNIKAAVVNLGEAEESSITVNFYNGEPATGELIGQDYIPGPLAPGEMAETNAVWSMPEGLTAPIEVYAVVDTAGRYDRNRSNDSISMVAGKPDLSIDFAGWTMDASGNPIVTVSLANLGPVTSAPAKFSIRKNSRTGSELYSEAVQPINPGEFRDMVFPWDVTEIYDPHQVLYISVDGDELVEDFDRSNNEAFISVELALPDIDVMENSLDFGSVYIDTSSEVPVTVTNFGNVELVIDLSTVDEPFSIAGGGALSLAPYETIDIPVQFSPMEAGSYTSVLNITSNDPDEPMTSISLTGAASFADTTPPVVIPPDDIVTEATGPLTLVDIGKAVAEDDSGVISLTNDAPDNFRLGTTTVTWTATDGSGNAGTAVQTITIVDTTPPVVKPPCDIVVEASGPQTLVDIGKATATDAVGMRSITNDATDSFPVGTTLVTWYAVDGSGNTGSAIQKISVVYRFSGILPPVNLGKPFKLGSTVPVKFELAYSTGETVTTSTATLTLQKVEDGIPVGAPIVAQSTNAPDIGNVFRIIENKYIFNLSTDNLSVGDWQLQVQLDDGTTNTELLKLK